MCLCLCRCGDTVPSTTYGFLPFRAIAEVLPENAQSIYILTDPSARATIMSHNIKFHKNCPAILTHLFDYLKARFPSASIIVKSGIYCTVYVTHFPFQLLFVEP